MSLYVSLVLLAHGFGQVPPPDQKIEVATARAKAALALAKLHHAPDCKQADSEACPTYKLAKAQADREHVPLMTWVGKIDDATAKAFPDAVHVCVPSWKGDATPRVIWRGRDGSNYTYTVDKLGSWAPAVIRQTITGKPIPPTSAIMRRSVSVSC